METHTPNSDVLTAWKERRESLMNILSQTSADEQLDDALNFCRNIHAEMQRIAGECVYADFLSAYSQLLFLDVALFDEEIRVTEELIDIRRRQAEQDPHSFLPYVTNCLFYLAYAHCRAKNSREAMSCIEQAVDYERLLQKEVPDADTNGLAMTIYIQAHIYDCFARKILAEDCYIEALEEFDKLLKTDSNPASVRWTIAEIQVALADFYLQVPFTDKAIERYLQAAETYRKLLGTNPEAFDKLKQIYDTLSELYHSEGNLYQSNYYRQLSACMQRN